MKFSLTEQEKVIFKYRWLLNRGDHIGGFDCLCILLIQIYLFISRQMPLEIWIHRYQLYLNQEISGII